MLDQITFATAVLILVFVWAAPLAVISIDPRISFREKLFWLAGTLILSWVAVIMYTFLAPLRDVDRT